MNNFAVSSNVTKQYRWWSNDSLIQRFKIWDIAKDIKAVKHSFPEVFFSSTAFQGFLKSFI